VVGAPGVAGDALGELVDRLRGHRAAPAEGSPAARRGEGGGGGGNLVVEPWWRRWRRGGRSPVPVQLHCHYASRGG
jgi:hypothetical protein